MVHGCHGFHVVPAVRGCCPAADPGYEQTYRDRLCYCFLLLDLHASDLRSDQLFSFSRTPAVRKFSRFHAIRPLSWTSEFSRPMFSTYYVNPFCLLVWVVFLECKKILDRSFGNPNTLIFYIIYTCFEKYTRQRRKIGKKKISARIPGSMPGIELKSHSSLFV